MTNDPTEGRARREAAALLAEHGEPRSRDTLVALLAVAYAKGAVDASTEALAVVSGEAA